MSRDARRRPLLPALAGAALLMASCAAQDREPEEVGCGGLELSAPAPEQSVVVVVGDTLRRATPGAYGGSAKTPTLDRVAREGILFARAYSPAPWTKPAVASLFTSLHPSQHRAWTHPVSEDERGGDAGVIRTTDVLDARLGTLAEVYREAGFATAAFVANPWLVSSFGFAQGFDTYDDSFARWEAPGAELSRVAISWLEALPRDRRFFLYLHYIDPHRPYGPLDPEETRALAATLRSDLRPLPGDARKMVKLYARYPGGGTPESDGILPSLALLELSYRKGVERFDDALGAFLAGLHTRRGRNSHALVVTSDHGESLYAHGFGNHGSSLYEDEVAIPLLMQLPGVSPAPARSTCPVSLIDLMPVLCRYSGLPCPADAAGGDAIFAGGAPPQPHLVVEGQRTSRRNRGLIGERYKLIWQPDRRAGEAPYRLYDLSADPDETRDLLAGGAVADETRAAFERLRHALPGAVAPRARARSERVPVDPELAERLRALGYAEGDESEASPAGP